ncbi:DNA polymerase III subunit gamma/tau [Lamprobacter modestohalophilus]|uniref:DNA polymerase III subunit gamma/tau n=1 Tax=Lamprobacter modestohalophilus TaxID=1064514 RepID=A0A9X1B3R8_9GAMM|nr:DNA polymerase III subunit gamma/tau [Lamprobacter modestohalophilus]MBK1617882.1 DNA polymerase III subunit gamma/tau [Lamprobacter modestohalophilus]
MTYQVLARKWRPRSFSDLVGQEHVVRALVNGLERGQLHHAYLLTGTRGVGKTTLARILAKTLNCEQGVSPTPCGVCSACTEIDAGRFVDLLEVDAASRTKVDQTRELLDNVPFAPVRGRFKVYLIDEVHMFSASSFNALLKTLEEPPPHVKFVLATTDPQRLPATVLSRCLQFNLKRLLPEQIRDRFVTVLEAESLGFEMPALTLLARAADGSMRDGLSLLDQAIAYGAGLVKVDDVRAMLGTRGGELTLDLLESMAAGDAARVLAEIGRIAELTPDFSAVLVDLIGALHRLALAQQVPSTLLSDDPDDARLDALAKRLSTEDVQLYYQVLLTGQGDLELAPDPRAGLEMVLLRALAFRPASIESRAPAPSTPPKGSGATSGAGAHSAPQGAGSTSGVNACTGSVTGSVTGAGFGSKPGMGVRDQDQAPRPAVSGAEAAASSASASAASRSAPEARRPTASASAAKPQPGPCADSTAAFEPAALESAPSLVPRGDEPPLRASRQAPDSGLASGAHALRSAEDWEQLVASIGLGGLALELARHCALSAWDGKRLRLVLDPGHLNLRAAGAEQRLGAALAAALASDLRLEIVADTVMDETPALRRARDDANRLSAAERALQADPVAQQLRERFEAEWVPGTLTALPVSAGS